MKAMLLAAGVGERLLPLTLNLPKPAIPVLGRPLALRILKRLGEAGIEYAVVNLHHRPERLRALIELDVEPGMPAVRFTYEDRILGTAGGLRNAAHLLRGDSPILVHNSDFLSDIDIAAATRAHRRAGGAATLVLVEEREGYSTIEIDRRGRVLSIAGDPVADPSEVAGRYTFTGCHLLDDDVLERIPAGGPSSIVPIFRELAREGRLAGHVHDGFWWEFGSPGRYLEGVARLLDLPAERRRQVLDHDRVETSAEAVVAFGPGAQIDPTARLSGRTAIGMACQIGRASVIHDSVIMPEAWVGPGCRLQRSIVGFGVELPAGFSADGCVVCADPGPGTELPSATRRVDGLLVHPFAPNGDG
jgi:NDP-sugar pyrophosphorylase family protein